MTDITPDQQAAVDRAFELVRPLIAHACKQFIGREVDARYGRRTGGADFHSA
jgi:hypothetical protein